MTRAKAGSGRFPPNASLPAGRSAACVGGRGAAVQQPTAGPLAAPRPLCKHGHDLLLEGVYEHMNSSRGYIYRMKRCRRCSIDKVQKCRGRIVPGSWWLRKKNAVIRPGGN